MNKSQFIQLLEQEVEDFIQTQAEKVVKFEDDPMAYILQKYPSLQGTLEDLMTSSFEDYITGIYVMAPKPTTFKVLLHNGQQFYLIYARDSYIAKIAGKKYYLLNLGEEEYAIKAIADLLTMGKPPGSQGPDAEEENTTNAGEETEEVPAEGGDEGGEEELAETKEKDPIVKAKTPTLKFKILKESEEKKKSVLKFKILKEGLIIESAELKQQIIDLITSGEYSEEQLSSIRNSIAGVEYKEDFFNYTQSKKMSDRAAQAIYNKALNSNNIQEVLDYIKSEKPNFNNLPKEGNINNIKAFQSLGDEFVSWLYQYTTGASEAAVGVGKMEEFLIFMLNDTDNPGTGDVGLKGGGDIEVKGDNAKIWGQKKGLLSTAGFNRGAKSIEENFGDLVDEVYVGQAGKDTAIASILLQNVARAIQGGADKNKALEATKDVLKDFYITSEGASKIDEYITADSLSDTKRLNTDIFKAQLNLYAEVEGWEYLWIGNPKTGSYRIFTANQLDSAIDSGDIKISSSMGLNNIFRMKIG